MKKLLCFFLFTVLVNYVVAAGKSTFTVLNDNQQYTTVQAVFSNIIQKEVITPQGKAWKITMPGSTQLLEAGNPDLPKEVFSVILPIKRSARIEIIDDVYEDIENIEIAPSKGKIYRNQDPNNFPYTYGNSYNSDSYYPLNISTVQQPYTLRDLRAQSIHLYPVQYNPVSKTMRVHKSMRLKVIYDVPDPEDDRLLSKPTRVSDEFDAIYEQRFLNYKTTGKRYSPIKEVGTMLIVCPDKYLNVMQPFIQWKEMSGTKIYLCNTDTITGGVSENALVDIVKNYYIQHQIAFLLLVGDHADVPTRNASFTSSFLLGPSDNAYAYINNNDHYPEFIVGRFSGESAADIETQVMRSVSYEKTPNVSTDWMRNQVGIASDQGPGDDNQYDYEHVREILDSNKNHYSYLYNYELYDGTQGGNDGSGNPSASELITAINNGVGLINYTGHGSDFDITTSGFSKTDVNSLDNSSGNLPVIFCTACLTGNFTVGTCIAESLLRSKNSANNPTGAAASLMSTILQSWDPPMQGQDEMNAILRGERSNNKRSTFGAIAMSGCMSVNDEYNTFADPNGGNEITDTWTVFGDPSLEIRTNTSGTITCTHSGVIGKDDTSFVVPCSVDGATVGLYYQGAYLASAISTGGVATFSGFKPVSTIGDTVFVTATKQNMLPYMGHAIVIANYPTQLVSPHEGNFDVYPNPVSSELILSLPANEVIVSTAIQDMQGKTILQQDGNYLTCNVQQLPKGNYIVQVSTRNNIYKKLVMKQ